MEKNKESDILNAARKINLEELSIKQMELVEITDKCSFYMKKCICWYLKPFYILAYFLILFIVQKEGKFVRKN